MTNTTIQVPIHDEEELKALRPHFKGLREEGAHVKVVKGPRNKVVIITGPEDVLGAFAQAHLSR